MAKAQRSRVSPSRGRLERRLSLMTAGLVAVASLLVGVLGLWFEWGSLNRGLAQRLEAIASVAALDIAGDRHSQIQSEEDQAYLEMATRLSNIREELGLEYVYTVVKSGEVASSLVVDGSAEPEPIGTIYEDEPEVATVYETKTPAILPIENVEGYGWLMTAYAPILNEAGEVTAVLGADMAAGQVIDEMITLSAYFGILWLIVTGLAIVMALRSARHLARRIEPLYAGAQALAAGDLTASFGGEVNLKNPDELDALRTSLQGMQQNLYELVRNMHENAAQVVSTSQELVRAVSTVTDLSARADEAMQQVATGTHDQADSATEMAGFLTQFRVGLGRFTESTTSQAGQVSQAAEEASNTAQVIERVLEVAGRAAAAAVETTEVAQAGSQAVGATAGAVQQIAGSVSQASQGMQRLSHQAADIGQISATIRDLAEQSNMLALNAAIEAARAGESGRGFAVVADEVRKLAARSGESADQIGRILESIRRDVEETLGQMNASLSALEVGREKADRAQQSLATIEASAQRTRTEIERVATDSRENARVARSIGEKTRQAALQVMESTKGAQEVVDGSQRAQQAVESVAAISEETAALASKTQTIMTEVSRTLQALASSGAQLGRVAREMEESAAQFKQ